MSTDTQHIQRATLEQLTKVDASDNIYKLDLWLKTAPQGYLVNTRYGKYEDHPVEENPLLFEEGDLRDQQLMTLAQFVVGERAALFSAAGCIPREPDHAARGFLSTQTADEGRHVEVFSQRLFDLGVKREQFEDFLDSWTNPHIKQFSACLDDLVKNGDYVAAIVGNNIILEGLAFSVFEFSRGMSKFSDPVGEQVLCGVIADERRHVGFGENHLAKLTQRYPESKAKVEKAQKELTGFMFASFKSMLKMFGKSMERTIGEYREVLGDFEPYPGIKLSQASANDLMDAMWNKMEGEFKARLHRIGVDYQEPYAS